MEADVIHGADLPVDVGDADGLVSAGEFFGFVVGGKIRLRSDLDEVTHESCVMPGKPCRASLGLDGRGRPPPHDPVPTRTCYFGCIVCATITWRLKSSIIRSSSRTSVGRLARVMVSILSCSLSSA